ncbi:MAG TPA: hypothetical protein VEO96_09275 [Thermoplasmata archaeon]|nr:hypothetical protein [Thermoplasmata archaeon]
MRGTPSRGRRDDHAAAPIECRYLRMHRFDEIRTMLHTHVDAADCLQIFVAEGSTTRLKELIGQIRRIKGIKVIEFIQTAARR